MSPGARSRYFGEYWPAACQAKGWRVKDEVRRRHTTGECMRLVRGPQSESTTDLGPDEITALFTYLDHLAHPSCLVRSARWLDCQKDYRAFNRARQADWYEGKTYGHKGSKKLRRDRFAGQQSAQGEPLDQFDPAAAQKRFVTMKSRFRSKEKKAAKQASGSYAFVAMINGRPVVGGVDLASGTDKTVNRMASAEELAKHNCAW